eukprot:gene5314-7378_t
MSEAKDIVDMDEGDQVDSQIVQEDGDNNQSLDLAKDVVNEDDDDDAFIKQLEEGKQDGDSDEDNVDDDEDFFKQIEGENEVVNDTKKQITKLDRDDEIEEDDDEINEEELFGRRESTDTSVIPKNEKMDSSENELDKILGKSNQNKGSDNYDAKLKSLTYIKVVEEPHLIPNNNITLVTKTPKFLKIQSKEFDSSIYDIEEEKKLCDPSTTALIYWRYKTSLNGNHEIDDYGNPIMESNARMLKWDDGTYQLVVGDAVLDLNVLPIQNRRQKTDLNHDNEDIEGLNSSVLQCIGKVQNKMIIKPNSLKSQTHNKMSLGIAKSTRRTQGVTFEDVGTMNDQNPEKLLEEQIKEEEENLRRLRKQRQSVDGTGKYGNNSDYSSRRPSMSASYLNDDSIYDGENLRELKKKSNSNKSKSIKSIIKPNKEKLSKSQLNRFVDEEDDDEDGVNDGEDDEEEDEEEEDVDDDEDEDEEEEEQPKMKKDKKDKKKEKKSKNNKKNKDKKDKKQKKQNKKLSKRKDDPSSDEDEMEVEEVVIKKVKKSVNALDDNNDEIPNNGNDDQSNFLQQRKRAKLVINDSDEDN